VSKAYAPKQSAQSRKSAAFAPSAVHRSFGLIGPGPEPAFADNRPQAPEQQEFAEAINSSPRVLQHKALFDTIRNSPRVMQQKALSDQIANSPRVLQQKAYFDRVQNSPYVITQRQRMEGLFGAPAQRREMEVLPGEQETAQRVVAEAVVSQRESSLGSPAQLAGPEPKPNRTGLPDNLKSGIESLSGIPIDNVHVHYNSTQPAQLHALAYTQGNDIHVAPGQEQHLPHEAWHVVQQAQGRVKPTMQMKDGVPVNDDQGLEHEADVMGARAMEFRRSAQGGTRARPEDIISGKNRLTNPIVQRRIGFEFETGIPVAEQGPGPVYQGLDNDELEAPFPGGKLMVDHLPGHAQTALENYADWNIVEFVTNPISDGLSEASFRNTATTWIHNLQAVEAYAQANHTPVQNAPSVGAPGSGLNVYIGIPAGGAPNPHWDRFSPQATMGIKLSKIGSILENDTQANSYPGFVRHDRVALGAQPSNAVADQIMDDIHAQYPMKFHTAREGYKRLQGLMVLICNYILTGAANAGRGGYFKNHTALLYKTMLSSVRNDIIGTSYVQAMLGNAGRRVAIQGFIENRTGRTAGDEVFPGAVFGGNPILVGQRLNSVLAGGVDQVFLSMKNPWSNEIGPENVRGSNATIMEMRDTSDFGMSALGIAGLHDTTTIIDYLAGIYRTNKRFAK
jgi:hypothetical protein